MGTLQSAREVLGTPRRLGHHTEPIRRPTPLDVQVLPYWWHPDRLTVERAPDHFLDQLAVIHPGLSCTKYGIDGTWILWSKDPTVTHHLCPGWKLLFLWQEADGTPLPLDARVFVNLALRDPRRYRSASEYFALAETQMKAAKDLREAAAHNDSEALGREYFDGLKIKNIGPGNKAALHHDGTVVPSRGHAAMLKARR